MSKKDFVMLARVIASLPVNTTREDIAKAFAVELMNTSQKFKMQTFLNACKAKETA